jgi:restriction system protein
VQDDAATTDDSRTFPTYVDLLLPTLRAVSSLGGSAQAREITARVIEDLGVTDKQLGIAYPNRPKSVFVDRLEWARSYAKMGGALDSPQRGLFVLSTRGKELLALPEPDAVAAIRALDRDVRANQRKGTAAGADVATPEDEGAAEAGEEEWTEALLGRLHRLAPEGFEEFVMYLLRAFGLQLERVGGVGDKGIDGIGTAPLSPVLSSEGGGRWSSRGRGRRCVAHR